MGNITIDRYFDRIVMSNPGSMLISLEEFYEGGHSICRNPVLQKMFIFIGVGEKGGSGADVIGKGWHDNGWQTPTMSEHSHPDRTETILPLPERLGESQEKLGDNHKKLGETDVKLGENQEKLGVNWESIQEKLGVNAEKLGVKLTKNRKLILRKMYENPEVSSAELAQIVGISTTAIDKNIAVLRDKLIRRNGPDKGGKWEVVID